MMKVDENLSKVSVIMTTPKTTHNAPKDAIGHRTSDEIFNDSLKNKIEAKDIKLAHPQQIPMMDAGTVYETVRDECYHHFVAEYAGTATFEYYEPAYRFGAELAHSVQYGDKKWVEIEDKVAAMWDEVNRASWAIHRVQVLHGWNLVQHRNEVQKARQ
jgi:hypothetical protein